MMTRDDISQINAIIIPQIKVRLIIGLKKSPHVALYILFCHYSRWGMLGVAFISFCLY